MNRVLLVTWLTGWSLGLSAQSTYAPLNSDYYHLIERFEIKRGKLSEGFFSQVKPFTREGIVRLTDSVIAEGHQLSATDRFNLDYLRNDNWEWTQDESYRSKKPFLRHLYKSKSDFYHVKVTDFELHLNPVINLGIGYDTDLGKETYINTRGVELRGIVDDKVGFYSFLGETQARFPQYVQNFIDTLSVVPHEGFWKTFKDDGVDFFTPKGYITWKFTKHIHTQFGYDKNVIGNGHRTFILSDFSSNYLFWKINTRVWRLNYQNLFTKMTADVMRLSSVGLAGNDNFPHKWMSMHHLSIDITDNINIGVFESVIFGRQDSTGNNPFKLEYLNPVIFLRAIEQQGGSPDNVLLGMDFKWNFLKQFSTYGQFILDEFLLENVTQGNGWWGNKWAMQFGVKYIDVFNLANLDLQLEYNVVRPFTHSHQTNFTNHSNYQQSLGHPLGANFREFLTIVRYQPLRRLNLVGKLLVTNKGTDAGGSNWGGNILLDNGTREQDFGNEIGQGVSTDLVFFDFTASYHLKHNFFLDFKQIFRDLRSEIADRNSNASYSSFALRWNIPKREYDF